MRFWIIVVLEGLFVRKIVEIEFIGVGNWWYVGKKRGVGIKDDFNILSLDD